MRPFARRSFICVLVRSPAEKGCVESYGSAVVTGAETGVSSGRISKIIIQTKRLSSMAPMPPPMQSAVSLRSLRFISCSFLRF